MDFKKDIGSIVSWFFVVAAGVFVIRNIGSFDVIINSLARVSTNTIGILEQQAGYPKTS